MRLCPVVVLLVFQQPVDFILYHPHLEKQTLTSDARRQLLATWKNEATHDIIHSFIMSALTTTNHIPVVMRPG